MSELSCRLCLVVSLYSGGSIPTTTVHVRRYLARKSVLATSQCRTHSSPICEAARLSRTRACHPLASTFIRVHASGTLDTVVSPNTNTSRRGTPDSRHSYTQHKLRPLSGRMPPSETEYPAAPGDGTIANPTFCQWPRGPGICTEIQILRAAGCMHGGADDVRRGVRPKGIWCAALYVPPRLCSVRFIGHTV